MGDTEYAMRPRVQKSRPDLGRWVFGYLPSLDEDMRLAVWTIVFIASGKAAALKGRCLNANHDIGQLLERARYIEKRNMYALKADLFDVEKIGQQHADFYRNNKFLD
ncbi:Hypothetical protein D9617_17g046100 [Elsinoe fawcettii]|nr:Hypothetical protein D9617_17g046100 [Elsinoe fawcettii]